MNTNFTDIVLAVIGLLSAIVTGILIPYIRSKTTKEKRENIYTIVKFAVQAAEQIFLRPGEGQKKKQFVIDYLSDRGIKLSMEDLNILIESAVKELNLIQEKALE